MASKSTVRKKKKTRKISICNRSNSIQSYEISPYQFYRSSTTFDSAFRMQFLILLEFDGVKFRLKFHDVSVLTDTIRLTSGINYFIIIAIIENSRFTDSANLDPIGVEILEILNSIYGIETFFREI